MFKPQKKSYKNEEDVHVKNAYYTFSKYYPGGTLERKQSPEKKSGAGKIFKRLFVVFLIVVFAFVGYFSASLVINISNRKVSDDITITDKNEQNVLTDGELKSFYYPSDKLNDSSYMKSFVRRIRWKDADSVVLEFKNSEGKLLYSSNQLVSVGNSLYDNETVRKAISFFNSKGLAVVASVYCFEDDFAANANPDMAVKYPDSEINWLDGEQGNAGKSWLNPYSEQALYYVESVIKEISDFNIDGYILKSASFPSSGDINHTEYPGESKKNKRHSVLKSFITEVDSAVPGFVTLEVSANQLLSKTDECFYGNLSDFSVPIIINTKDRPDGYTLDKETEYSSMFSFVSNICSKAQGEYVVKLAKDEAPNKFIKLLNTAGYNKIIIE